MKKLFSALLIVFIIAVSSSAVFADLPIGYIGVNRLYNPKTGEHLYTTDQNEVETLKTEYGWDNEGVYFMSHDYPETETAIYRLYNQVTREHLYTTDPHEVEVLSSNKDWSKDNNGDPIFYGSDAPEGSDWKTIGSYVYRLYNPTTGLHLLTNDSNEINELTTKGGWQKDGDWMFYSIYPSEIYFIEG